MVLRVWKFKFLVNADVRQTDGGESPELKVSVALFALLGGKVFLFYFLRCVKCADRAVRAERLPAGMKQPTRVYAWFRAR